MPDTALPNSSAYSTLEGIFGRLANLGDAAGLLSWDTQTMMPTGSADSRAEAMATLSVVQHQMLTDPRNGALLDAAAEDFSNGDADPWRVANLREMRRQYLHSACLSEALIKARSLATSRCEIMWREARRNDDFKALLPSLEEVLRVEREVGQAKGEALGLSLYDALLESYEPDARSAEIDPLFDALAEFLPGFIDQVVDRQAAEPEGLPPDGPFPMERQEALCRRLMKAVGFDFNRGRLDVSLHPFCGGSNNDVRVTTRYDEDDFTRALMGVLHETGHALYEQGRPAAWLTQPVGESRGLSLHESQSLIIEMQACRSRAFLTYATPLMREAFAGSGPAWAADNIHRLYTRVARTLIRVDADEVTYPAHVILRYRLEKAMLAGDLALKDLPGAWAEGMQTLLHVTPPDDRQGCLQDIHWPGGAWGYFPTYTLGAMTAAQLFQAARAAEPDLMAGLAEGDFTPLRGWLRRHVHGKGSLLSASDLLVEATGKPLDAEIFKDHLRRRYLEGEG